MELQYGHGAGVSATDVPQEGEQLNADASMSCRPVGVPPDRPQRPASYDGCLSHLVTMLARINRWTEEEKATYLAVGLRGPALTVLSNMAAGDLYDYKALVAALETHFGSTHQAELHWMHLRNCTRRRDKSLPRSWRRTLNVLRIPRQQHL